MVLFKTLRKGVALSYVNYLIKLWIWVDCRSSHEVDCWALRL